MEEKPNFVAEIKAARARDDQEAVREVFRRAAAWQAAQPPPRRAGVATDLLEARQRGDAKEAERVVMDALKQKEADILDPDDLVWVVGQIGAWESSWRAGQAIAAWLYHHGPIHRGLVETAEDIASYDNAEWLDDVLLWIEPTPQRWFEHACWVSAFLGCMLCSRIEREGLDVDARRELYAKEAVESCAEHAKRVIDERRDAARRSLLAAAERAKIEDVAPRARWVLDAWKEALT